MKKRFTEEQIIGFLREAEMGLPVAELCRRHGFSQASYYLWHDNFGGIAACAAIQRRAVFPDLSEMATLTVARSEASIFSKIVQAVHGFPTAMPPYKPALSLQPSLCTSRGLPYAAMYPHPSRRWESGTLQC